MRMRARSRSVFALLGILCALPAAANLPANAISKMEIPVYGIYTSADPTCMTGLVATVPISATPTTVDFAKGAPIGKGKVPAGGINCVVFVVKLIMAVDWKAGTYTTTSSFGGSTFNDSNCNAGGTTTMDSSGSNPPTCASGLRPTTIDWPAKIVTDLNSVGLTPKTDCTQVNAGTVLPLYLSTYSKCVGVTADDNAIGGTCAWSNNTDINAEGYRSNRLFQAPTAADDAAHGININGVRAGVTQFKLIIDPSPAIGGNGNSATDCGGLGPPKFSFKDK